MKDNDNIPTLFDAAPFDAAGFDAGGFAAAAPRRCGVADHRRTPRLSESALTFAQRGAQLRAASDETVLRARRSRARARVAKRRYTSDRATVAAMERLRASLRLVTQA